MFKYLIGVVAVTVLVAGGYYVWQGSASRTSPATTPTTAEPLMSTFASTTFSIKYPPAFAVDDSYTYDRFGPKKLIHGVKFTIPGEMATGTNLAADAGISVESLPRAKRCTGDIYLMANVRAERITENGTDYSFATSSGAAAGLRLADPRYAEGSGEARAGSGRAEAGNLYEEFVYALSTSSPCMAVRYLLHSGDIRNYEPNVVREFDRRALVAEFDKIRRTLILNH